MPDKWSKYAQPAPAAKTDKWAQYAKPAAAAPAPASAKPAETPQSSAPKTLLQKITGVHPISDTFDSVTSHLKNLVAGPYHAFADAPRDAEEQQIKGTDSGSGRVANAIGQFGLGAARMLVQPTRHALRDAEHLRKAGGSQSSLLAPSTYDDAGNNVPTAGSKIVDAIPLIGPWARGYADEVHQKGVLPATAGLATDVLAPEAAARVPGLMKAVPELSRRAIAGDISKPVSIDGTTPMQRYSAAKHLGVQLDAADATNGQLLKGVKKISEHSLAGSGPFEDAKLANTSALHGRMGEFLDDLYPGDRESGGAAIQNALRSDQSGLKSGAEEGFQRLTDETKGQPMAGSPAVGSRATELLKTISPLAEKYPSLAPGKTMNVLSDLSKVGNIPEAKPVMSKLVDESGQPIPSATQPAPPKMDTFADLQRLRSATHDLTTTNPDLVKSQAIAPLQQMTKSIDDAMTDAAGGLTPEQTATFRDANSKWLDMKSTYDDPSSPLYHAVRSPAPSKLYTGDGLGAKTPEVMRELNYRLGDNVSPLRRGTVESALKATHDGVPNYKHFGLQLNRIPQDYLKELLTPEQRETAGHLADVGQVLGVDGNPSGSAKLGQKVLEGSALGAAVGGAALGDPLPLAGALAFHGAQYGAGKLMNSPAVVDWLMTPKPLPNLMSKDVSPGALVAPAAASAGAMTMQDQPVVQADPDRGVGEVDLPVLKLPEKKKSN